MIIKGPEMMGGCWGMYLVYDVWGLMWCVGCWLMGVGCWVMNVEC